jgi:hypothetical protein
MVTVDCAEAIDTVARAARADVFEFENHLENE